MELIYELQSVAGKILSAWEFGDKNALPITNPFLRFQEQNQTVHEQNPTLTSQKTRG